MVLDICAVAFGGASLLWGLINDWSPLLPVPARGVAVRRTLLDFTTGLVLHRGAELVKRVKSRRACGWDNMRVSVFVSVALVAVLLAEGTSSGSCEHFAKPRTKPREIRGFQPEYISTAYGFGKREIAKQDKYEKIMLLLLQNSPQSIPASWFLHEMRQNPELAKRIVRKIVDGGEEDNPGKLSTAELFKSERKISFF